MSRQSGDDVDLDGIVRNGFDYNLQVWVENYRILPVGLGADKLAGLDVRDVAGHEVRTPVGTVLPCGCRIHADGHGISWCKVHGSVTQEADEQAREANLFREQLEACFCPEPEIDDTVLCCPDCERPNQFGELCDACLRERAETNQSIYNNFEQ